MYIFFFNDTATTEIYTLSLHDALPIYNLRSRLIHIAVPHRSAEVLLGAGIREPCGYRGRLVQCRDQGDGLIQLGVGYSRRVEQFGQNHCYIYVEGGRNQKNLVQVAVYTADHCTAQRRADLLECIKARSVAHNESIVGGGADRPQPEQEQEEYKRFGPHGLLPLSFVGNG